MRRKLIPRSVVLHDWMEIMELSWWIHRCRMDWNLYIIKKLCLFNSNYDIYCSYLGKWVVYMFICLYAVHLIGPLYLENVMPMILSDTCRTRYFVDFYSPLLLHLMSFCLVLVVPMYILSCIYSINDYKVKYFTSQVFRGPGELIEILGML